MFMLERPTPAPRGEIDRAALELLARHGAQIMATARRYAATPEDAEDAYQRGLEILLTKAPTTREGELVPWLKTVVKHEAFALRRQRDRLTPVTGDGEPLERGTAPAATHDQAERYERLSQGAEALRRLKPQEIRCLVLKAQGLSYQEICDVTGWTYTKVNRCLTEGRQALTVQLAGIEGGIECARLAPLLSALADGEATAEQLAVLRPHMKTCLACRARLREFRAAPSRVAALVPPAALAAVAGGGTVRSLFESAVGAAQHKAAAFGDRVHAAAELATGQKVAAMAASAAALAGGGTAVDQFANHRGPPARAPAERVEREPVKEELRGAPTTPVPVADQPATTDQTQPQPPAPAPAEPAEPEPPPPDPANEFTPSTRSTIQPEAASSAPASSPAPPTSAPAAKPAPVAGGGGGPGEFAP